MKPFMIYFATFCLSTPAFAESFGPLVYRICSADYDYAQVKRATPWNAPPKSANEMWVQISGSREILAVPAALVMLESECAVGVILNEAIGSESERILQTQSAYNFPTILRPTANYKSGQRAFGAGRSGGRLHAACDLYRIKDEPATSIGAGKVIRDKYFFYEGTYAVEVKLDDGRVIRYGEVTSKTAPGIALGKRLTTGQVVGYIGKVNSGCCEPMLHFEVYSGKATGALTQSGNKYQRRSDLVNPSKWLTELEMEKFGAAYPFGGL